MLHYVMEPPLNMSACAVTKTDLSVPSSMITRGASKHREGIKGEVYSFGATITGPDQLQRLINDTARGPRSVWRHFSRDSDVSKFQSGDLVLQELQHFCSDQLANTWMCCKF